MVNHQQVVMGQKRYKKKLKGTYLLLIELKQATTVRTRAKVFLLSSGFYIYVGSAMNSLIARVGRHERSSKKFFWHVDFLLHTGTLRLSVLLPGGRLEEKIASRLSGQPVVGFGSSDSNQPSHLFLYNEFNSALGDLFRAVRRVRRAR